MCMSGWTKSRSQDYWARSELYGKRPSIATTPKLRNRHWFRLPSEAKEIIEARRWE
jgi:hypothetical protein